MRILITSLIDFKKTTHSRPHQFIKYLAKNHEVTALCLNAWWIRKEDGTKLYGEDYYNWYFEDILQKVKVIYLTNRRISPVIQEITSPITIGSLLKKIDAESFDVYINSNAPISGYAVTKYMKHRGIPTIFDIADDLPRRFRTSLYVPSPLRPLSGLIGRWMLRENIKLATKITFITKALKDSYNFPDDKSVHIPNGVDTELFHAHPSRLSRKQLGIEQDFVLGFVGTLIDWIDFEPVFAAIRELSMKHEIPNLKMLVVGGEGRLQENKDLARKYGIEDRIIFTGTTPYTQGPKDISCMDVCLICRNPTTDSHNALPLKLFEYMACEKPVISTPLAGVKEAVGDRVLYASNAEEFKERVLELYHNEELRKELGEEGRRFVEQNYRWEEICRRFEEVLIEAKNEKN